MFFWPWRSFWVRLLPLLPWLVYWLSRLAWKVSVAYPLSLGSALAFTHCIQYLIMLWGLFCTLPCLMQYVFRPWRSFWVRLLPLLPWLVYWLGRRAWKVSVAYPLPLGSALAFTHCGIRFLTYYSCFRRLWLTYTLIVMLKL